MPLQSTGTAREYIFYLSGEIDHHGAKALLSEVEDELARRLPLQLTLDLGGVSFMDSSGIALLMRCKARVDALGGSLHVVNTPPQALRMLQAAKIPDHIHFT